MEVVIKSKVSMPEGGKIFQGDNNMDFIVVQIDRFYGDFDLVDYDAYLKIKYVDDTCNQVILNKIITRTDRLIYEARIDSNFTRFAGEILCQPYFCNKDKTMCFNASTFTMEIEGSIQAYETIAQEVLPGVIETLEAELKFARQEYEQSIKNFELGDISESEVENAINLLTDSAIYRFFVVKNDGYKEPRILFVNRFGNYEVTQTMLCADQTNCIKKIISRGGTIGSIIFWQLWSETEFVSKEYVDNKILDLRLELGLEF